MKRSNIITARMTETEHEIIKAKAAASNQSISRYIIEQAIAENIIPNKLLRQIYQKLMIIKDNARYAEDLPAARQTIEMECDKLWQLLN